MLHFKNKFVLGKLKTKKYMTEHAIIQALHKTAREKVAINEVRHATR